MISFNVKYSASIQTKYLYTRRFILKQSPAKLNVASDLSNIGNFLIDNLGNWLA